MNVCSVWVLRFADADSNRALFRTGPALITHVSKQMEPCCKLTIIQTKNDSPTCNARKNQPKQDKYIMPLSFACTAKKIDQFFLVGFYFLRHSSPAASVQLAVIEQAIYLHDAEIH